MDDILYMLNHRVAKGVPQNEFQRDKKDSCVTSSRTYTTIPPRLHFEWKRNN